MAGISLKQAMQLARHSDPKLTMARYGRAQLHDLGESVARLPNLVEGPGSRDSLRAAVTDGARNPDIRFAPRLAPSVAISCESMIGDDTATSMARQTRDRAETATNTGLESECEPMILPDKSSGDWDRTSDPRLMKPLL